MNYQVSWQEKAKQLPQEILSRLLLDAFKPGRGILEADGCPKTFRALIAGDGIEFLLSALQERIDPSIFKIFISGYPAPDSEQKSNLIYLKGSPIVHFTSFPRDMYDLIISLWNHPIPRSRSPAMNGINSVPPVPIPSGILSGNPTPPLGAEQSPKKTLKPELDFASLLSHIYRLTKSGGQFAVVTYLDGSPEMPLNIIKSIIKRHKDWSLKLFRSALPRSASEFRKMLYQANLCDSRTWEDGIAVDYQSAEELSNDIFAMEAGLFSDALPPEYASVIKKEFSQQLRTLSYPLKVTYNYAAATGLVEK